MSMYYISKAPNGGVMVSNAPPKGEYFTVEALPEGEGRLMVGADGSLYLVPFPATPAPEEPEEDYWREMAAAIEKGVDSL